MYPRKNPSGVLDRDSLTGNSQRQGRFQNDMNQPNYDLRSLVPSDSTEAIRMIRETGAIENLNKGTRRKRSQMWPGVNLPMPSLLDDEEYLATIQNIKRCPTKPDRPSVRFDEGGDYKLNAFIDWNYPNANGSPVTGYTLDITKQNDFSIKIIKSNHCKAESNGLECNTNYSFRVKAENYFGEGPYSDQTNVKSPPGPPSPVKGLNVVMVTFQLVLLQFDEPNSNGSDILSYVFGIEVRNRSGNSNKGRLKTSRANRTIESSDDKKSDEELAKKKDQQRWQIFRRENKMVNSMWVLRLQSGDKNEDGSVVQHVQYLIHELDDSTSYRISVQAVNDVGIGLAINFLEVTTYPLPKPPASLNWSKQDSFLKFTWEPVPSRIHVPMLPETFSWLRPPSVNYNVKLRYPFELDFSDIYNGTDVDLRIKLSNEYDTADVRISSGYDNMFSPSNKTFRMKLTDKPFKDVSWSILTKRDIRITGMESLYGMWTNIKTEDHATNKIRMIQEVQQFCERELARFELQASNYILENGLLSSNMFTFDEKSRHFVDSIKRDLEKRSHQRIYWILWSRVIRFIELIEAIMEKNYINIAKVYYKLQCRHTLYATDTPVKIPIFIKNDLASKWKSHLRNAIDSINVAAPGLYLYITDRKETARVIVGDDQVNTLEVDTPSTRHLNKEKDTVFIHLPKNYPSEDLLRYSEFHSDDLMEGSAIHEILHALKFDHHYQRFDADLYLSIDESLKEKQKNNISKTSSISNLVRHDLSSILHTNELKGTFERIEGDPFSALKTNNRRSCELSEGDKVALNLKYKPCRSNRYNPEVNSKLGIVYCGRFVMTNHDQFSKGTTDKYCGPNNWANCPACRVILDIVNADGSLEELPTVTKCIADGRWQGFSGLFYCGKTYNSAFVDTLNVKRDGVCGPDVGIPCTDCGKKMYPEYSIEMYLPKKESPVQPKSTPPNRMEQNPKSVTCTIS